MDKIILWISSNGIKLQLLISKGKKEKLLNNLDNYYKSIFVLCQENSCAGKSILNIAWRYIFNNINITKKILILDSVTTHYNENLSQKFDKYNSNYILFPPSLKMFVQPLDMRINSTF